MGQKIVFSYEGVTGIYLGETVADESPLEPGVFLMPRHTTDIEPPSELAEGMAAFWRDGVWSVETVPERDDDLDGKQDAPQGFEQAQDKPGYFVRLIRAIAGR